MFTEDSKDNIAIVGVACKVPGAKNATEFWNNLKNGVESIQFFSDDELIISGVDKDLYNDPNYIRARGILGDAEYFDSSFFGFSPREAEITDPQQRIFLECAWEALEDSGYDFQNNENFKVGVFGGAGTPWHLIKVANNERIFENFDSVSIFTSNENDYIATRTSYKLGLNGPSINLQSACSTSLAAVVLASNSLLTNQCDIALAGGVSIRCPEKIGYLYQPGSLDSADGHCRTFSAEASGTVFSHGAGIVVLKRLSEAIKAGDNIYGIIKGMAINNDGNRKVGFSAPSIKGQKDVEIQAIKNANIDPETISYVEAHGTGTKLGDPIEFDALSKAFRTFTEKKQFCGLGSVKTNIGHTDAAAGVISLIKVLLCIKHNFIPKALHFTSSNPEIDFYNSPFFIQENLTEIQRKEGLPFRSMINSFGVGGTNVSMIIEEHNSPVSHSSKEMERLFVISAKTSSALDKMQSNLFEFLNKNQTYNLDYLSHTLQFGRKLFKHRKLFVAKNMDSLLNCLKDGKEYVFSSESDQTKESIVFLFPGQGTQYVNMAFKLYNENDFFKKNVDDCFFFLKKEYSLDIKAKLFCEDLLSNEHKGDIQDILLSQTSLFIVEYSLAKLLNSLSVFADFMIGHSLGEYTAACLAGVFSKEEALSMLIKRSELLIEFSQEGAMLAVLLPESNLLPLLDEDIEIAVVSDNASTVVSGPREKILNFHKKLKKMSIASKLLSTKYAFHSSMMDKVINPLREFYSKISFSKPNIPILSAITGNWLSDEEVMDPNYWAMHLREKVNFSKALEEMISNQKSSVFVEIGPGNSLKSSIKKGFNNCVVSTLGDSVNTNYKDIIYSIGKLWAAGASLLCKDNMRKVSLPTYPFEKEKFLLKIPKKVDLSTKKNSSNLFHTTSWKRLPSLALFENKNEYTWIVFVDKNLLSRFIIEELSKHNIKPLVVNKGIKFSNIDENNFTINSQNGSDYQQLFESLGSRINNGIRIIYLWNSSAIEKIDSSNIHEISTGIFDELLLLEQAMIQKNLLNNLKISVITSGLFDVAGEGVHSPVSALALGPCKVFMREHKQAKCQILDLPINFDFSSALINSILSDCSTYSDDEVLAYRGEYKWGMFFAPLDKKPSQKILKEKGVYIITGGLGGIGLTIAEHLYNSVRAKLVLIYSSPLPDRSDWIKLINTDNFDNRLKEKIRWIMKLENMGADILLFEGNVCDIQSMNNMIELALNKFGEVNGLFHSAGIAGDGVISLKNIEKSHKVISPKVQGTVILDEVTSKIPLDFFVLFSSITSYVGEAGQVDYCSANAFLNAFAGYRKFKKRMGKTLSINWGKWTGIGMAVKHTGETYNSTEILNDNVEYEIIEEKMLDAEEDWIVAEHKLLGSPTLVGTAYINILNNVFRKKCNEHQNLVITDMIFLSPLIFNSSKKISLNLILNKAMNFKFISQQLNQPNKETIRGNIGFSQKKEQLTDLNLEEIKNKLVRINLDEKEWSNVKLSGESFLDFGSRWQLIKEIFAGNNEWLALLKLSQTDDLNNFPLHPAMLDVATAFCIKYVSSFNYLPISYGKIQIQEACLSSSVFSYVKLKQNSDLEFVIFDVVIMDETGHILLIIEDYMLKRVTEKSINFIPKANKPIQINDLYDISPQEGARALIEALEFSVADLVVYHGDIDSLIAESFNETITEEKPLLYTRKNVEIEYVEPNNEIEETIKDIWQLILGIDKIGIKDNFIDLGGNSLIAIQIVSKINKAFNWDYTINKFYNDLTIFNIAERIVKDLYAAAEEFGIESGVKNL
ncbi:MAG: beta-ketoacyl synthase N-terminal-like domain-containing protein [Parachlamydiales bacterium]|jgi:acyl transferase domain-containing protein/NAD(P)-dependent dehydrogenase (short-subunit alcohol dehydrogenase family)/acyl carrier protein